MIVPTPRFWLLLALGVPIAAVGYQQGVWLMPAVYDGVLFAAAAVTGWLGPRGRDLKVARKFDQVLSARVSNRVELSIENLGADPMTFTLRDEPPPTITRWPSEFRLTIGPGGIEQRQYHMNPQVRGSDYFRGTYLRLACPLGLVVRQERLPTDQPFRVYPNVLALREFDLLNQKGRLRELGIRRSRRRGLGMEFESLREWTEGDDFRKIDWMATARRDRLIVRQYETERNQSVLLGLDVGRHMLGEIDGVTKLDHALDACLLLAHAAAAAGDNVGLFIYADHVIRYLPPRKGRNQVGMIIEALHDQVAQPVETDAAAAFSYLAARWKRRSLIVNFSDSGDADRAGAICVALAPLVRRHLVLLARVSDPRLKEVLDARLERVDDLYKRAAALLLDDDRRQATSVLTLHGVHSLESEPQDLAANLVSFYFQAKEHALI
ncbi:MAG: DUF58 domain-containing protein [Fimbriimonadaceae bacterium]